MREDEQLNINFVKKIEEFKCLYDYTIPDYKNTKKQEDTWRELAVEFDETVPSCKERWRNLRGCYTRNLKQKSSGKASRYRKPYYLAEYMNFVYPFTKPRKQYRNHAHKVKNESSTMEELDKQDEMESSDTIVNVLTNMKHSPISSKISSSTFVNIEDTNKSKLAEEIQLENSTIKQTIEFFEPKKESVEYYELRKESSENDADLLFLKSLLPDIGIMNASQRRKLRINILKVIDDILSEETIIG